MLPIPGDWYDADYFEHGLKSNWDRGYTWPLFKGVFEDTARYLEEMFPEAASFLDVGCAKGFLVKALREARLNPEMKVMMVTTEADHSFISTALDNGADEFLMKPFTPESLREKMLLLGFAAA